MELLPLVCLCLLSWSGTTSAGPPVVVKQDDDAVLPCSFGGSIESALFDWKKDGQPKKEVFLYDNGDAYRGGRHGQAEQFKGRVSHFQDELKHGNASIKITKATMADSGDYTCFFPNIQPPRTSHVELVVGAAPEPSVTILDETEKSAVLQCKVHGVPDLEVHWQDSDGNKLTAEEPQVTERGGLLYITVNTTVDKTDYFSCVATQKKLSHEISAKIYVRLTEDKPQTDNTGWIVAGVLALLLVVVGVLFYKYKQKHNKGSHQHTKSSDNPADTTLFDTAG